MRHINYVITFLRFYPKFAEASDRKLQSLITSEASIVPIPAETYVEQSLAMTKKLVPPAIADLLDLINSRADASRLLSKEIIGAVDTPDGEYTITNLAELLDANLDLY